MEYSQSFGRVIPAGHDAADESTGMKALCLWRPMSVMVALTENDDRLAKNHLETYLMGKTIRSYLGCYSV